VRTLAWAAVAVAMSGSAARGGDLEHWTSAATDEVRFRSGPFTVVGELRLPRGEGPHPVVVFVHGDGPNSRTSGGTYPPIMDRMLRVGYATFAWDKPGTGASTGDFARGRKLTQRARIVLDAIALLRDRPAVDPDRIGLWGISQAGYVMPRVLERSDDVAFLIAVSCPGEAGVQQGAYLLASQAVCAGMTPEEAVAFERDLEAAERAQTYADYVRYQKRVFRHRELVERLGFNMSWHSEADWEPNDPAGDYFFDPVPIIARTTIPVLAFYGERDTQVDPRQGMQAYRTALERAGNPRFRIELVPGVDHCMIKAKTGCLAEVFGRTPTERVAYGEPFLEVIEVWLRELALAGSAAE
jgi:pimeloyl-ACP methyl ester carboxylesterase